MLRSIRAITDVADGFKQKSSIHCGKLVSLAKSSLSHFIGALSERTVEELPEFARYSQASAR